MKKAVLFIIMIVGLCFIYSPVPASPADASLLKSQLEGKTWEGKWGGSLLSSLTVFSVDVEKRIVRGMYRWADHPSGRFKGGKITFLAKLDEVGFSWSSGRGDAFFFVLEDGILEGAMGNPKNPQGFSYVSMKPQ